MDQLSQFQIENWRIIANQKVVKATNKLILYWNQVYQMRVVTVRMRNAARIISMNEYGMIGSLIDPVIGLLFWIWNNFAFY